VKFVAFCITYDYGAGTQSVTYTVKAASYAHAAAKCAKKHPGCRLLPGLRTDEWHSAVTHYEGVSQARVVAAPTPKTEQTNFAFADQCKGKRLNDVVDWNGHGIGIRRPI
jgi:hypothetical protein